MTGRVLSIWGKKADECGFDKLRYKFKLVAPLKESQIGLLSNKTFRIGCTIQNTSNYVEIVF